MVNTVRLFQYQNAAKLLARGMWSRQMFYCLDVL